MSSQMEPSHDEKYHDEPRLPTFEDALTEERLLVERKQLMEATKQLARLQLDMETKVRAEMEAKMRAEMEAKMRSEVLRMEEDRKAQEERRQLEEQKKAMRDPLVARHRTWAASGTNGPHYNKMAEFVEKHTILSYTTSSFSTSDQKQIYVGLYLADTHLGLHMTNGVRKEIRPFYFFDSELTQRDLTLWANIENSGSQTHPFTTSTFNRRWLSLTYIVEVIAERCGRHFGVRPRHGPSDIPLIDNKQMLADFETIVRLIPGSYRNGPWRPLDGFFGPYLNEETLEITTMVPVLE